MKIGRWMAWALTIAVLAWGAGSALAQGEPTIDQIYQAASSGRLSEARSMIDQVVTNHPKSAKAHYVKAEVAARQREAATAREELAAAERIAPGLPFARPEAVKALRTQIEHLSSAPASTRAPTTGNAATPALGGAPATAPSASGLPWGKIIIGLAIALGIVALLRRRMPTQTTGPQPYNDGTPMPSPGAYGPGSYGLGPSGPGMQPPPGAGPYPYGAPAAPPSMGSTIGRGLAAGLAVGAGAVAAQEIGRRMFDHRGNPVPSDANPANFGLSDPSAMDNVDLGGNDFGINDAASWDDGGSADVGGGDWDT